MPTNRIWRSGALLLGLLAFTACDSGDGALAHFDAALTGAVTADLAGEAAFGPVVEDGTPHFRILLLADEEASDGTDGSVGFYFEDDARPAAGSYSVGTDGDVGVSIILTDAQGSVSLVGVEGTLTVTESGPDGMSGTFEFDAETLFGGGETSIAGAFTATPE